ncbi:MAG: hypothetical protein HY925_12695 [Elusimicrobia bacterium]|nr:hypothetical protein [Elusimicrobiota bacterium]
MRRRIFPGRFLLSAALLAPQCEAFAQTVRAPVAPVSVVPQVGIAPLAGAAPFSPTLSLKTDLRLPAAVVAPLGLAPRALPVAGSDKNRVWNSGLARVLAQAQALAAPAAEPREVPEARITPAGKGRVKDAWLYSNMYLSSLYWYTGPRLIERWDELRDNLRKQSGDSRAVADIRGFFIAHRVLGSTGSYGPLGFRVASNRIVVKDAVDIYDKYFVKNRASKKAFMKLIQRAQHYNPNRRSTQFRKAIFHALREASVLPPDQVAAFFDSQLGPEKSARLEEYQRDTQDKVLQAFDKAVNDVISEMNKGLPAGERVMGTLLLGSFANGAAGPGSDLDVQALTEGGSVKHNAEFIKRIKKRWAPEEEWSGSPVSTFQYALPLSKRLVARVHREPYLIFSPYPEVTSAMTRTTEEEAADAPSTIRTFGGWLFQRYYTMVLHTVLAAHDLGEWAKKN